jgi:hypothetical protein
MLLPAGLFPLNHERIPDRTPKNANDYYIPLPGIELVKRMPMFSFPSAWNTENNGKYTPRQPTNIKILKKKLLDNML